MFVRVLFLVVVALMPLYGQQRLLTTSEILKREGPAVVMVETSDNGGKLTGQASGVVLLSEGVIATNFHVIEDACNVTVKFSTSGKTVPVTALIGVDQDNDLALLRVNAQGLPTAEVGKSAQLNPGDGVVAIGNPMGLEQSVSEGIISGIRHPSSRYWIQTTAPISPGSSGGGLYSRRGELVGITSFTLRESQNLNFAVPVERALGLLNAPYTPSQEVPWSRIRELRCKQSSDNLDWSMIAGVLGRPIGNSEVQDILRKLNAGTMPTPTIGGSPERGELRFFEFPSLGACRR
jgi:S1-C subfamily serine protease